MLRALVAAERPGEPVKGPKAVEAGKAEIPLTYRVSKVSLETVHPYPLFSESIQGQSCKNKKMLLFELVLQMQKCKNTGICVFGGDLDEHVWNGAIIGATVVRDPLLLTSDHAGCTNSCVPTDEAG